MRELRKLKAGIALFACLLLCACSTPVKSRFLNLSDQPSLTQKNVRQTPLQPHLRYLWIETHAQEALMVWVGNEASPLGEASVWVSADGVIVRTVKGQLVGVSERLRSWRLMSEDTISNEPESFKKTTTVQQTTDVQPGWHVGVMRTILKVPLSNAPAAFTWVASAQPLQWVEDTDALTGQVLATQGFDTQNQTIAGHRCVTAAWCLRWQAWPAQSPSSAQ